MTQRPYELLVRFSPSGSIAGASVRYVTTLNGRDYEGDPLPLQGVEDPAFLAFSQQFGAAAIAERDQASAELLAMTASREAEIRRAESAEAERDSLASSLAAMTAERDESLSQVSALSEQLAAAQVSLSSISSENESNIAARDQSLGRVAELETANQQLQSDFSAAQARIADLQTKVPWDVRIIDASAFLSRISQAELLELATSEDPTLQQISKMLSAYRANDWPIMLDSPEMQQAIGYLTQIGFISQTRADYILRDSTREEAYKAGE